MFFWGIVVFVLIVCVYKANNRIRDLEKENKKLKQELLFMKKQQNEEITVAEKVNAEKMQEQIQSKNVVKEKIPLSEEEKKQIALKKEKQEREARNTTILITGAVLIVLSAIVFLMSTWYTIPNILKTAVLVLLIAVFFGGSKIAKEKFGLEKTSNTFFYMAMAYIPICLFSISFFGLLGDFLSLNGAGKYIYLTTMGIVTASIYYVIYKKNNSKILFYGSLLSQVFSVILFSLIFDNRLEIISLNLLLYNLLFILLTSQENNQFIKNIKNIYAIIPYVSTFMICIVFDNVNPLLPINIIILAINYLILEVVEKKKIFAYLFNIVVYSLGIYCIWRININLNESVAIVFTLLYSIGVYAIQNVILFGKEKRNLKVACSVVTLSVLQILFFSIYSYQESFIRPYIISAVQCVILLLSYIGSKEFGKKLISYLLPICFITTGIVFLNELDAVYHWYIIFSIITFAVGELLRGKKAVTLKSGFFMISHLLIALTYLIVLFEEGNKFINDVIYYIILLAVYCYSYLQNKKSIFKYFAYMMSYFVFVSVSAFFNISEEFMYLIPTIMLIVLLNLEKKYTYLEDNGSRLFFAIAKIIAYVYLTILENEIGTIISIGLTAYFVYDCHKNNENSYGCIIPLIGTMPNIFDNALDPTLMLCIMLLTTIGLTVVALKNKKISVYTIFSGIYLLLTLEELDTEYVSEILFTIWAVCNWYFIEVKKEKDIFKFISYIGGLVLYNQFAYDLDLTDYTAFLMLGYIIFAIAIIRTILNNYMKNEDIDVLEALTFICMYIFAINLYSSEYDGMLFGILIVAILIVSYIKKYGMLFLTSTGAILLNVFLLTRAFWFSIPWWVYLLIIGSVLITFAVKNEANEKKDKISIGNTLKKLKDKIEK